MVTLNLGPCAARASDARWIDSADLPDAELSRLFDFVAFTDIWCGGHKIVLDFLSDCAQRWPPRKPITILDLFCGRGDLTAAIIEWGEKNGHSVEVLAVDRSPRKVEMAKRRHGPIKRATFDVRDLNDPSFLQAQQFDYVVSGAGLNGVAAEQIALFLKTADLLARRGLLLCDWLRDIRALFWLRGFAWFWRAEAIRHDAPLFARRGFTTAEVARLAMEGGCDYLKVRRHLGYRFSLAGERAFVFSAQLAPVTRLAGI